MPLESPIFVKPDNTANENFMQGFSLLANLAQKRQREELQKQKMMQDAALKQQQFGLDVRAADLDASVKMARINQGEQKLEIDRQAKIITDETGQTVNEENSAMAKKIRELNKTFAPGTSQHVQGMEDIKDQFPLGVGSVHGNRIWKPTYDTSKQILTSQQRDFAAKNKGLFGTDISDPWENLNNWQDAGDGKVKFPVWGYANVPDKTTGAITSQPVHMKDVIMTKANRDTMAAQYERIHKPYGSDVTNPPPDSPMDDKTRADLINEVKLQFPNLSNSDKEAKAFEIAKQRGLKFE